MSVPFFVPVFAANRLTFLLCARSGLATNRLAFLLCARSDLATDRFALTAPAGRD